MIRADIVFDFEHFDKLGDFVGTFPAAVMQVAPKAFNQHIRLGLLAQLRKTPKRRFWTKTDFASDASRRAFFAKTGGKAYTRTGKLAAGWSVAISVSADAVAFGITNKVPYEKWVTGKYQVKGHAKTGWPLHAEIFDAWRPRVLSTIKDAADALIAQGIR